MGDEPVPVVTWLEVREDTGVEGALGAVPPAAAVRALGSACPQTSQ